MTMTKKDMKNRVQASVRNILLDMQSSKGGRRLSEKQVLAAVGVATDVGGNAAFTKELLKQFGPAPKAAKKGAKKPA